MLFEVNVQYNRDNKELNEFIVESIEAATQFDAIGKVLIKHKLEDERVVDAWVTSENY